MARGRFFTTSEIMLILTSSIPDEVLSKRLGRTVRSIRACRSRYSKKLRGEGSEIYRDYEEQK
jgi:hypothetical protein